MAYVVIGRLKPSPQSERWVPSDAIVEFAFVELNVPIVMNGRMLCPCINCSAVGENFSAAGSKSDAGSRYSPKRVTLARRSNTEVFESTEVQPPEKPVLLR